MQGDWLFKVYCVREQVSGLIFFDDFFPEMIPIIDMATAISNIWFCAPLDKSILNILRTSNQRLQALRGAPLWSMITEGHLLHCKVGNHHHSTPYLWDLRGTFAEQFHWTPVCYFELISICSCLLVHEHQIARPDKEWMIPPHSLSMTATCYISTDKHLINKALVTIMMRSEGSPQALLGSPATRSLEVVQPSPALSADATW